MSTYTFSTTGIVLSGTPQDPVTIATGGYITNTTTAHSGDGIYGNTAAAWNISNFGTIKANSSANGSGIFLKAGGTLTNGTSARVVGTKHGIYIGGIAGTISNSGAIYGTGTSGDGVYLTAGGYIVNSAGGIVTGYHVGASINTRAGTISNSATIEATGTFGFGVYLQGGGNVANTASGLISGEYDGAMLKAAGTVTNFGAISGASAVVLANGGKVVNGATGATSAHIDGTRFGVRLLGAAATVSNFATITASGSTAVGISLNRGLVANYQTGLVIGSTDGVLFATSGTVDNSGTISGLTGVEVGAGIVGASIVNRLGGLITGEFDGVGNLGASASISNYGNIQGTGSFGAGIYLRSSSTVVNNTSGEITGRYLGISDLGGRIANFGTIATGADPRSRGIQLLDGYVVNYHGAVISANYFGVYIGPLGAGALLNSGTINALATGTLALGAGVRLKSSGTAVNQADGLISGYHGIVVAAAAGIVSNAGTVTAIAPHGFGILLRYGSVANSGTVIGGTDESGIELLAGNVTNSGTVIAGTNGIGIALLQGNVTNTSSGAIIASGSAAAAVYIQSGTFFNLGLVQGQVSGIAVSPGTSAGAPVITVSGTVVAATGITVSPGSIGQTLTVNGAVTGTAGTAVSLGGGSNRLILSPGAAFQGKADGGGGSSVVEVATAGLAGSANVIAAIVDLGSIANFSQLQIDFSAVADASGTLSFDTLSNEGLINLAAGDSLAVGTVANAASAGTIDLRTGGTAHFEGVVSANQTLQFRPPGGTALLDHPEEFAAAISDFSSNSMIDLPLGTASFQGYSGGVLTLTYGGASVGLAVTTTYTHPQFLFGGDGGGGTAITVTSAEPTISSLTASPAVGDLNAGKAVAFTLAMSWAVTVAGGTPGLLLNDGGTAIYDLALSTASALVFD